MYSFTSLIETFDNDHNLKGNDFEVLCKWILENHPVYKSKLKKVYLWDDWPGRWGADLGIDLVAESCDGENWAIQAKCYDQKYYVTKQDVNSFLSESVNLNIQRRLLIATTDNIGPNAKNVIDRQNQVIPVNKFMLSDLLAAPINWPESISDLSRLDIVKPFTPLPYQEIAINKVTESLSERGQLIMACGTGKTLTGLWIAEELKSTTTIVLLPSLLLLSKTLHEWLLHSKKTFDYLPVCSDETVSKFDDSVNLSTSDLIFPSTTDVDEITKFIANSKPKVIFSTYQSSERIAEAFKRNNLNPIDLIIADEAHRCTGKVDASFSTILDSSKIPAFKRLFMTATPKIYTNKIKKKASESGIELASMDDRAMFGPVLHELSFGEAIEKELLTDFQVVIVGIDNPSYLEMIDDRALVKTDTDLETDAQSLAAFIAMAKAIKDFNLTKIISFHSRVSSAAEFSSKLPKVINWMSSSSRPDGEIISDYVSGNMPTNQRNKNLQVLGNINKNQRYVLSNARCLSEGVDVPSLDGIAFIDPKQSEIDIIQAVGRAIRLSKGKKIGTVVIPIFIEEHDDPSKIINSTPYKKIWSVINALRSHDEGFGEELDSLRQNLGKKGSVGISDKIFIDLPLTVSHKFEQALKTKIIESTTESWEYWYGMLCNYVDEKKHARVESKEIYNNIHLGVWCDTQRTNYKKRILSKKRISALEKFLDYGWVWSLKESQREANIEVMTLFYNDNGHCLPKDADTKRSVIAKGLRKAYDNGSLDPNWIDYLENKLFFKWDPEMFWWLENYKGLRRWARTNKSSSPPKYTYHKVRIGKEKYEKKSLSGFRGRAITSYKYWSLGEKGNRKQEPKKLSPKQIMALENIPYWAWNANDQRWNDVFIILKNFFKKNGHSNIKATGFKVLLPNGKSRDLSRWCSRQREFYADNNLDPKRVIKLNSINFDWVGNDVPKKKIAKLSQDDFNIRLNILKKWISINKHALVPQNEVFEGYKLGSIVSRWRQSYFGTGREPLSADQIIALESSHTSWLWSAADTREGLTHPVDDRKALLLLKSRKDHEINQVIKNCLFAGLRIFESTTFEIKNHRGIDCFYIKGRSGYCEHYIPIHKNLNKIEKIEKSSSSLGTFYRRLDAMQGESKSGRQFFSLHLTFRKKLIDAGLESDLVNALSGYNPRLKWTKNEILKMKTCIDKIKY